MPDINNQKKEIGFIGQKTITFTEAVEKSLRSGIMTSGFYVTSIGYFPNAKHHYKKENNTSSNKDFILLYCLTGFGYVKLKNQSFVLKPDTFFIIPPDTPYVYYSDSKNSWSIFWAHFKGKESAYLYARFMKNKHAVTITSVYATAMLDQILENIDLLKSETHQDLIEYTCIIVRNFLCFLVYQNKYHFPHQKESLVNRATEFLKDNLDQNIKIEDLSKEFNLSVSRFTEVYKKQTGYAPIQHLILLRIQKSCVYLQLTDLSIKEVSAKVGFEDPFYFSRMFKKMMGVAPKYYKNTTNADNESVAKE